MSNKNSGKEKKKQGGKKFWDRSGKTNKVKGDEADLGGNVFSYGKINNVNQYNVTFEAILSYIGQTYSKSGDIIKSLRNGFGLTMDMVAVYCLRL